MALKGSCPGLLLALVLLGTWLTLARGQRVPPMEVVVQPPSVSVLLPTWTNEQFLRRHWDFPKTGNDDDDAYCDLQTRSRGITGASNTFIHEHIATINGNCAGKRDGPVTSRRPFSIIVCRFNPTTSSYTGMSLTRRIEVVCRNRLPVLYERFV